MSNDDNKTSTNVLSNTSSLSPSTLPNAKFYNSVIAFMIPLTITFVGVFAGSAVAIKIAFKMARRENSKWNRHFDFSPMPTVVAAVYIDAISKFLKITTPYLLVGAPLGGLIGMRTGCNLRSRYVNRYNWKRIEK